MFGGVLVCTPPLLLEWETCRSVGAGLSHLHRSFGRYSKKAPSYRSATRQRQNPFRIPSPFDPDVRGGTFDGPEGFRCKVDVRRVALAGLVFDVFFVGWFVVFCWGF